jgi:hypothetical protein
VELSEEFLNGTGIGVSEGLLPLAELQVVFNLIVLQLVNPSIDVSSEDSASMDLVVTLLIILLGGSRVFVG